MLNIATKFVECASAATQRMKAGKDYIAQTFVDLGLMALKTANGATNRVVNAVMEFGQTITAASFGISPQARPAVVFQMSDPQRNTKAVAKPTSFAPK